MNQDHLQFQVFSLNEHHITSQDPSPTNMLQRVDNSLLKSQFLLIEVIGQLVHLVPYNRLCF